MDFDRLELKLLENFLIYKNYWGVHSKIEFLSPKLYWFWDVIISLSFLFVIKNSVSIFRNCTDFHVFLRFYAHSMCNIFMKTRVIATFLFVCLIAQSHLQLLLISAIF